MSYSQVALVDDTQSVERPVPTSIIRSVLWSFDPWLRIFEFHVPFSILSFHIPINVYLTLSMRPRHIKRSSQNKRKPHSPFHGISSSINVTQNCLLIFKRSVSFPVKFNPLLQSEILMSNPNTFQGGPCSPWDLSSRLGFTLLLNHKKGSNCQGHGLSRSIEIVGLSSTSYHPRGVANNSLFFFCTLYVRFNWRSYIRL